MNIKDFKDCVEFNIRHGIKHAILGLGAPGIGKSQVIKQIGEQYGMKVIDIRLAQMSEVEIGGLIYPNEDRTKTVWLTPEILPDEERDGKNTILLLDEITSCTKRVQVAAYQLILDRRIGQYRLPKGTFVIALGNREDDDGVFVRLAGPLADRFEIHYIEPDFDEWMDDYAVPHGVHPLVKEFLSFDRSSLHTHEPGSEDIIFATPRSWDRVSDILKLDPDVNHPVVRNKIIGNVGKLTGNKFIEFCRHRSELPSVDEFLNGAELSDRPDVQTIIVNGLIDKVSFLKEMPDGGALTKTQQELLERVLVAFFRLSNPELTIVGLKSVTGFNRSIVKTAFFHVDDPRIGQFLEENRDVLDLR